MTHALIEQSKLLSKPNDTCSNKISENNCLIHKNSDTVINNREKTPHNGNKKHSNNDEGDENKDDDNESDEFFDCASQGHGENYIVDSETRKHNGEDKYPSVLCNFNNKEFHHDVVKPLKHIFPNVVVNSSNELSDLDSDEEDYRLRISHNDSGQGSSVETASLRSNPRELCTSSDNHSCIRKTKTSSRNKTENDAIMDVLNDIDLSTNESLLPLHYNSTYIICKNSPDGNNKTVSNNNSFTDVPLNAPSWPLRTNNTYKPTKNILTSDHQNGLKSVEILKPPSITDIQPKTKFLHPQQQQRSWKVFGKIVVPVPNETTTTPKTNFNTTKHHRKTDTVGSSTTALILENRPSYLPPKSEKEERKHRLQYEEMIALAKRKELRDQENEKKKLKQRRKLEDQLSNTVKLWKEEVIPQWDSCYDTQKVRALWWHGIPPSVRGTVWRLAIGNDLHMTPDLFRIFQDHAEERIRNKKAVQMVGSAKHDSESSVVVSKENAIGLITLDVSRTFPALGIFQQGGPYHEPLKKLLHAYTCHRPDVGYVQGMSFLAAMLLLNMDLTEAFIAFSNLLSRSCQMAFFMVDQAMMDAYFRTFDVLLEDQVPRLHVHFKKESLSPDIYLIDWIFTVYSKSLPLDTACRVWDLFLRDGEEFLFRTALGILLMHEDALLEMEFFRLAQYLTKLSNTITADQLFSYIDKINFTKQKFQHTLTVFKGMMKPTFH